VGICTGFGRLGTLIAVILTSLTQYLNGTYGPGMISCISIGIH